MEDLQKEFIPYELALRMKQLEFDEECLAIYSNANPKTGLYTLKKYRLKLIKQASQKDKGVKAPTFSQAFRWFREKHFYISYVCAPYKEHDEFYFRIRHIGDVINEGQLESCESQVYNTYEEAELACLEKLCEIIEQKT
jgi:hypothetical protein